jgi:hypothetical protein
MKNWEIQNRYDWATSDGRILFSCYEALPRVVPLHIEMLKHSRFLNNGKNRTPGKLMSIFLV